MKKNYRLEHDALGELYVPSTAYYGIQTLRASRNFPISGARPRPLFIASTAMVKKAAARANIALRLIDKRRGAAIIKASDAVIAGRYGKEFIVDAFQAGAGTSHNMNANEVIANAAICSLGFKRGDYGVVHPNDHVNMSQSTNDVIPTAMRLSALFASRNLVKTLLNLEAALNAKSREFDGVIKSGRTHLQDAAPVRLGQEFGGYASTIRSARANIEAALKRLKRIGLGATAVGTGLNTHPAFKKTALKELKEVTGFNDLTPCPDPFEALNSSSDFVVFSNALKCLAIELIRITNDLRLLSSGPRTGLSEITLPKVQPGSSIMPGKVNPVMAEMLAMVCFQAIGNDLAVAMAAQAGQLELNVMTPVINRNILESIEILGNGVKAFTERCVKGIKADKGRCADYFERSVGLATVMNRIIGYEKAAEVARQSIKTNKTVKEVVLERGMLTEMEWEKLLTPARITRPTEIRRKGKNHRRR